MLIAAAMWRSKGMHAPPSAATKARMSYLLKGKIVPTAGQSSAAAAAAGTGGVTAAATAAAAAGTGGSVQPAVPAAEACCNKPCGECRMVLVGGPVALI